MQILRLLGRRESEDLDLVELVAAEQAARVLARTARFAPVTRRIRHHAPRQLSLGQDLVAVERRQRHFGRGDRPQVVALDVVRVVGKLRELPRRDERVGRHHRGRTHLFVQIGVAVEGELAQRAGHGRSETAQRHEHRARDLHGAFVVEDAEGGTDLPVRDALMVAELRHGVDVDNFVVLFALANERCRVGCVRNPQHPVAEFGFERGGFRCQLRLLLAKFLALGLRRVGCGGVTGLARFSDFRAQRLDLRRSSSRWLCSARTRVSSSTAASTSDASTFLVASAAFTASRSVRKRRMSSMRNVTRNVLHS